MSQFLIDEAWAKSSPDAVRAAGYTGVIGYISEDDTGKNLTRTDIDALHAAGLSVGFADEYGATEALGGGLAGTARARKTVAFARAMGVPPGVGFYAPADWDVTPAQKPAVLQYAMAHDAGLRDNGWRGGMYGGYWTMRYLRENGYAGLRWQTYAWSGDLWDTGLTLRQVANGIVVGGADVDRDEVEVTDWGQWPPDGSSTMGSPTDSWGQQQVYAAIFTGGDSCGEPVPEQFRVPTDTRGNSILSKLNHLQSVIGGLSVPNLAVSEDQMAAIGQLNNLLGQVAAHLK